MATTLMLTACGPKQPTTTQPQPVQPPVEKVSVQPVFKASLIINDIMDQARQAQDPIQALDRLALLELTAAAPVAEEAAFRRIQLMQEFHLPSITEQSDQLRNRYAQHPLIPYLDYWQARWFFDEQNLAAALESLIRIYEQQQFDIELIEKCNDLGTRITQQVLNSDSHPDTTEEQTDDQLMDPYANAMTSTQELKLLAMHWLLLAAHTNQDQRQQWIGLITDYLDMPLLLQLQENEWLNPDLDTDIYEQFSRRLLIADQLDTLVQLKQSLPPRTSASILSNKINQWLRGENKAIRVGVLLPLSGRYAAFGQQVLQGLRLFMQQEHAKSQQAYIDLIIQDTNQTDVQTAYRNLLTEQVGWIVGPLLSSNTAQLAEVILPQVPVISLSKDFQISQQSSALFTHSLARSLQARFMAQFAFQKGFKRVAVIRGDSDSETEESDAFIDKFSELGGEIADTEVIPTEMVNVIAPLDHLREATDDDLLLQELDQELALFSAMQELEVHLPVNLDAIYLALPGKRISQIAGQLAYMDISGIPLYGSNRWADGSLLNDQGRYLSKARFVMPATERDTITDTIALYRQIWGQRKPGALTYTAYDSLRIVFLLGSRMGLNGYDAITSLHDPSGFPGQSGHVYFNPNGIGEKRFDLYQIEQNQIKPAS